MSTVASGFVDKCIINPFGPMKMEFVPLSAVSTSDTYISKLQNPQYAGFFPTANNGIVKPYCTVSGRTVTITNTAGSATTGVLLIYGY